MFLLSLNGKIKSILIDLIINQNAKNKYER
jgi:hypothetical protein